MLAVITMYIFTGPGALAIYLVDVCEWETGIFFFFVKMYQTLSSVSGLYYKIDSQS